MKNAIVLCSGGLDSVTTAYYVKKTLNYQNLIILFFNYNQRTLKQERKLSKKTANNLKAKFIEIKLPFLSKLSTSLINSSKQTKKITRKDLKNSKQESNKYYVPCRNIVFLTYALTLADSLKIKTKKTYDIFTGFKNEGKEAYLDTTPEFIKSINNLKNIATNLKTKIIAPLIKKDKEDIIKLGNKLNIDFKQTHTCYTSNKHCGVCLSCRLRQEGFYWANIKDPTIYKQKMKDYRKA